MYIKNITIKSFGTLENKSFNFERGLNVLFGANESGKSTLLAFVVYMFYGTKIKKIRNQITFKQKYTPWNGSPMEGTLCFEDDSLEYVIRRMTTASKSVVSLTCITTGEEIKELKILDGIGEHFFGTGVEAFLKTAFFSALSAKIDSENSGEIISKLYNYFETGSADVSYKEILDKLNDEIADLSSAKRKNAAIPLIKEEMLKVQREISEAKLKEESASSTREFLSKTDEKIKNLSDEYNDLKSKYSLLTSLEDDGDVSNNKFIILLSFAFATILLIVLAIFFNLKILFGTVFTVVPFVAFAVFYAQQTKKLKKEKETKLFTIKDFNDKIMLVQKEIKDAEISKAVAEERLKSYTSTNVEVLNQQLESLKKSLDVKNQRLASLNLAQKALELGYHEMKTMFSPELSKKAGDILNIISGGKYSTVLFDDMFSASLSTDYGFNSAEYLSRGAVEQTYLSLRIALLDMVYRHKSSPLFLDDALAFFDTDRKKAALGFLIEHSNQRQVFFATCRENEFDDLQNSDDINIIYL